MGPQRSLTLFGVVAGGLGAIVGALGLFFLISDVHDVMALIGAIVGLLVGTFFFGIGMAMLVVSLDHHLRRDS